jgi:hypothetical protein
MVIFALFLATMLYNQSTYHDCKEYNFEPKACSLAKTLDKAGKIGQK